MSVCFSSMDMRLRCGSSMLVAGPSQSGKSTWVHRLLAARDQMFECPPTAIHWYHGQFTPDLVGRGYDVVAQGLPDTFDEFKPETVVVLDDLMVEAKDHPRVSALFTKWVHHRRLFVICISQNLFYQSKETAPDG